MSRLLIRGGNRLQGEVTIQGAKNSVLPILAATILTGGSVELRRCPRLRDVEASIRILQALGCKAGWRGDVLEVDTAGMSGCDVPDALMREMRSSVIFLGAILARCGEASLTSPGGCELGPRPIDLHLSGLRALGAEIDDTGGTLHCKAAKLTGREIVLGFPSVGATENLMLAACGAEGVTVLSNAAREPEIEDLQGFLNTCGAEITGAGTSTVVIRGGRPLHGGTYTILPDRIAAATYLCGAASAGGEVFLRDAREEHLSAVTAVLREAGCDVTGGSDGIVCRRTGRLIAPRPVRTAPYPGFPTDARCCGAGGRRYSRKTCSAAATAMWMSWPAWEQISGFPDGRRWCWAWSGSTEPSCGVRICVAARHCAQRLWQRRERPPFRTLPISTGAIRASRMIWRRWARIYGGWRRRPPPERQTVKENHHGKTERIGAAAQKGRQRLPL